MRKTETSGDFRERVLKCAEALRVNPANFTGSQLKSIAKCVNENEFAKDPGASELYYRAKYSDSSGRIPSNR